MSDGTHIEWTDATWNPITGCTVHSPGCTNCYAMKLAGTRLQHHPSRAGLTRMTKAGPVWNGEVRFNEEWLTQPLRWKKPRRIFVCAHADLFHENVPDEWIDRVFVVMALAPQHTFQVLTKRSARMREYVSGFGCDGARRFHIADAAGRLMEDGDHANAYVAAGCDWPLPNVWLGVSVEDQTRADERREDFANTPAAMKFISYEPALGPVDWEGWEFVDQIIGGGESGPKARPSNIQWFRNTRDFCAAHDIAYFHKQNGEWTSACSRPAGEPGKFAMMSFHHDDFARTTYLDQYPRQFTAFGSVIYERVGKKQAGRLLDGVEHNGVPAHG